MILRSNGFYKELYKGKDILKAATEEVFDGFNLTFMKAMNDTYSKEVTENELSRAVQALAHGELHGMMDCYLSYLETLTHHRKG